MSVSSFHVALGAGKEFDLIRAMVERWDGAAVGIGDDAAVIVPPAGAALVASTDAAVEGVHFRRPWLTPREIGYRACTAALSDLAAMAATPIGILIAICLPDRWKRDVLALADGMGEASIAAGAPIVGGNIAGGEQLAITTTVLGSCERALPRSGCRPGDDIWVTGRLGGPAAALESWNRGVEPDAAARDRFAHPHARIREARWLASAGARSAIDVSDGLVADLGHLASASGVRIEIDLARIPVLAGASLMAALAGGEEYELVVSSTTAFDAAAFEAAFGIPVSNIGTAHAAEAATPLVIARRDGAFVDLHGGYDHLSG